MGSRIVNRRQLGNQADSVETPEAVSAVSAAPPPKAKKKRASTATKAKTPRAKKAPPRMRARWGIFDGGMKQVAVFDYKQLVAAQERLADLLVRKKGIHVIQIVKEPIEEAPAEAEAGVGSGSEMTVKKPPRTVTRPDAGRTTLQKVIR